VKCEISVSDESHLLTSHTLNLGLNFMVVSVALSEPAGAGTL
jgi:hypothetical protein